ncbi:hypothetical protein DL766_006664 [Monosporascus sp. MC13-8B]|uniref:Uncharacterized protein n=1 Tax=Monosporascus cannonballus TaxID=155416 RepID=A0ABY0H075_9PEZI|nr:hypothetical protein DL763_010522 [Monosporascus cannonballus]RYO81487.1 hypothetical protein DL762_007064 [Monosporascus cannonballus]RYP26584.1 hypothetical protein DL766_006664 [Monosporascus sp. MC13-8B]
MAAAMVTLASHATTFEPLRSMSADEYRRELMIQYAFAAYRYLITNKEADEIIYEGLWRDADDHVHYMWNANFGGTIPGTTNVRMPSTRRLYTSEEVDIMAVGLWDNTRDCPLAGRLADQEHASSDEDDFAEDYETDEESNASTDDTDPEIPSFRPPAYVEAETAEVGEESEGEVSAIFEDAPTPDGDDAAVEDAPAAEEASPVEVVLAAELTPSVKLEENISSEEEALAPLEEVQDGVFSALGARLDRRLLKAKRTLARGLKAISPSRILARVGEVSMGLR